MLTKESAMSTVDALLAIHVWIWQAHIYFTQQCEPVEQSSEETRAVVGLLVSLVAEPYRLLYIDEPELHLSPTLASRLGQEIARRCKEGALHSFVATHSPDFITGCIESGASTQIVRLGGADQWSLHTVEPETVVDWMTHPLRRSACVYNGLFRDAVVVVEADSDRCFYEECTRRLASKNEAMRLENALFVNTRQRHHQRGCSSTASSGDALCDGVRTRRDL